MITVAIAGGFDPIHPGHISHIYHAKKLGHRLVVILARDDQLIKKKGYVFLDKESRITILKSIKWIDHIRLNFDKSLECAYSLELLRPDIFAKGGDRTKDNMPEAELEVCKKLGIKIVYNVGADKQWSSRDLVRAAAEKLKELEVK